MVTGERRAKGQALLGALERPGISQLQVREFLELADENGQVRPEPLQSSLINLFSFLSPLCNSYPFSSARCCFVVFVLFFIPFPSWEFC